MRRPWLAYLLTAIAACGIGVAIAGLPDGLPGDGSDAPLDIVAVTLTSATIESTSPTSAQTTTTLGATTDPPTTTTTSAPSTTTRPTTTTTTTTTTIAPPTTVMPATTTAPPTTSTTIAPPTPADSRVAVANGAGIPGIAGDAAELLIDAGFDDVSAVNSEPVDITMVYFVEGFEEIADLVAIELFIDPDATADMSELPELATDEEFDVVAVLGADVGP